MIAAVLVMTVRVAVLGLAAALCASMPVAASANDGDKAFFEQVKGRWQGPGEIVAGKYKGTKFVCTLDGSTPGDKTGMTLDGACNVGLFAQPMKASVALQGKNYKGQFMDGALGDGLDITSGNIDGDRVVFSLNRKKLDGAMLARLADPNKMNVTISVRVGKQLVPVIGMSLNRLDTVKTSSVD